MLKEPIAGFFFSFRILKFCQYIITFMINLLHIKVTGLEQKQP